MCVELRHIDDCAAAEQRAEGGPLRGAVDERRRREPDQRARLAVLGLLPLVADVLTGDEVDPAAECAPDVLMPPQHAFGISGGAAGIEDVEVVGAALLEVTLRRRARQRRLVLDAAVALVIAVAAVFDHYNVFQFRGFRQHGGDLVAVFALMHQSHEIGVFEQVLELAVDVAVVDVHRDRAQLVRRDHRLQGLDRVTGIDTDVGPASHAVCGEMMGEPAGPRVQFGEGDPPSAAHGRDALRHGVDGVLE